MSWARTFVSTGMSSPRGRVRPDHRTATPVTNIARVQSMNGAPRIAPTPTPCDASEPAPARIAMIGIIVSGSAVPTAARTDPTAPSASSSFRPNHSIPFVNSSAPARMTRKAMARTRMSTSDLDGRGERDAQADDHEDGRGDEGHPPIAGPGIAEQSRRNPGRWRGDDDDQPEPQEPERVEGSDVRRDRPQVEGGRGVERAHALGEHQDEADREEGNRHPGPD